MIRLLIKNGADPTIIDSRGKSPLHLLSYVNENDSPALADLMVDNGADLTMESETEQIWGCQSQGFTLRSGCALSWAAIKNRPKLFRKLVQLSKQHGATPPNRWSIAIGICVRNQVEMLEDILTILSLQSISLSLDLLFIRISPLLIGCNYLPTYTNLPTVFKFIFN
jgi:hypothetical protein